MKTKLLRRVRKRYRILYSGFDLQLIDSKESKIYDCPNLWLAIDHIFKNTLIHTTYISWIIRSANRMTRKLRYERFF